MTNRMACHPVLALVAGFALVSGFVILAGSASAQSIDGQDSANRPNIVLIMADDLGYECLGANGGTSWKTPNLDALAGTGMRFQHCYSQPLCTPSRVQLMTGIYNVRNYTKFGVLPDSETTFASLFRRAGYQTCVAGKWQLKIDPVECGFDEYCLWQYNRLPERYPNPGLEINGEQVDFHDGGYGPDVASDYVCDFIRRNADQPFLVYYPMILTHCPFCPTPDSDDWDPADKGSETYKGDAAYFGDMVTYMDKIVGKVATTLEEAGVRENTLLLFTGDNGTDPPVVSWMGDRKVAGGKKKMTDAGTRVPLIANWPGTIGPAQVSNELVDFSDFFPTICEFANITIPESMALDGNSFAPRLLGEQGKGRQWIYCWFSRNGGSKGKQWVRNQRYKLYASGKFFDVENDVLESHSLADHDLTPDQKSVKESLEEVLTQFRDARPAHVAEQGKSSSKK